MRRGAEDELRDVVEVSCADDSLISVMNQTYLQERKEEEAGAKAREERGRRKFTQQMISTTT